MRRQLWHFVGCTSVPGKIHLSNAFKVVMGLTIAQIELCIWCDSLPGSASSAVFPATDRHLPGLLLSPVSTARCGSSDR